MQGFQSFEHLDYVLPALLFGDSEVDFFELFDFLEQVAAACEIHNDA